MEQMRRMCSIGSSLLTRAYVPVAAANGMKGTISPKEKKTPLTLKWPPTVPIPFTRVAFGSSESPRQEALRLTDFQRLLPPQRGNVQFRADSVLKRPLR